MIHPPSFDEAELVTLIDRLVRSAPGLHGGAAKVRQITQKQERYRGGYDAVVSSVLPFYVQAKTASFHTEHSTSDIINARKNLGATCSPGAFAFYLRRHEGTTEPLQHNALYWLSLRSMAGYVCPTFVSEGILDRRMDEALEVQRHQIWKYDELRYYEPGNANVQRIKARHFQGLVTVVPHRLVDHYLHRYSYTDGPAPSVVFHSDPEKVTEVYNLEQFLEKIFGIGNPNPGDDQSKISAMSVDALRAQQLIWVEEALDPSNMGINITPTDASNALAVAGISSAAKFQRSGSVMNYLRKLDWLDMAAFYGGLLKEKYSIRQTMVLQFAT